jgi:hypothetical protein
MLIVWVSLRPRYDLLMSGVFFRESQRTIRQVRSERSQFIRGPVGCYAVFIHSIVSFLGGPTNGSRSTPMSYYIRLCVDCCCAPRVPTKQQTNTKFAIYVNCRPYMHTQKGALIRLIRVWAQTRLPRGSLRRCLLTKRDRSGDRSDKKSFLSLHFLIVFGMTKACRKIQHALDFSLYYSIDYQFFRMVCNLYNNNDNILL